MTHGVGACVLCGSELGDRHMALVEWADPVGNRRFDHVPRCVDRASCRARVEALGETWPVNDRTPAPPRPAPAEPVPDETAPAPQEEEMPWVS